MVLGSWGASLGFGVWQSCASNLVLIMSIGGEKGRCGRQRRRSRRGSRTAALASQKEGRSKTARTAHDSKLSFCGHSSKQALDL